MRSPVPKSAPESPENPGRFMPGAWMLSGKRMNLRTGLSRILASKGAALVLYAAVLYLLWGNGLRDLISWSFAFVAGGLLAFAFLYERSKW